MADQICYSVLCVFSYLAAGAEKLTSNQKIASTTPQASPMFVPLINSCIVPASPQGEDEAGYAYVPNPRLTSDSKEPTRVPAVDKKEQTSSTASEIQLQSQMNIGSITPTRGPPSYPPPALPPGVQPPAPPPGNIKPVTGVPQIASSRPNKPPPIPHRSSLSRQPSTPPPPPRPK